MRPQKEDGGRGWERWSQVAPPHFTGCHHTPGRKRGGFRGPFSEQETEAPREQPSAFSETQCEKAGVGTRIGRRTDSLGSRKPRWRGSVAGVGE